jgi:hypothetical protein
MISISELIEASKSKMYCGGNGHVKMLVDALEESQARVKELEAELCKLKRSYDIMSAYAVHYVPEHKTQELIKDVNKAYE